MKPDIYIAAISLKMAAAAHPQNHIENNPAYKQKKSKAAGNHTGYCHLSSLFSCLLHFLKCNKAHHQPGNGWNRKQSAKTCKQSDDSADQRKNRQRISGLAAHLRRRRSVT